MIARGSLRLRARSRDLPGMHAKAAEWGPFGGQQQDK
jgi:hypothetical protein